MTIDRTLSDLLPNNDLNIAKTILITGATGFIARHLIPVLHQQGYNLHVAIRNQEAIQTLRDRFPKIPFTSFITGDLNRQTDWHQPLRCCDLVVHLAARAHILNETEIDPVAEFYTVNTEATTNLVAQSIDAGVQHLILLSSIGAMASLSEQPLTEQSPCHPDTPYGQSKLQAENFLIHLATESKMTWTILRPPLVYGPGNPGNMERLIQLVNRGLPLPLGQVNNRRSLIYVGNLVDAIATCLRHPAAKNQLFLVSDGQDLSTPQLIQIIAEQLGRPCYLLPMPPQWLTRLGLAGDHLQHWFNCSLPLNSQIIDRLLGSLVINSQHIQTTLQWCPPYSVGYGIAQTLKSGY